ncbi:hypothetical protein [Candidatus Hamiltonella defensa]|uniref:hypothetical protein n=1 Tax=Candidatus Williamhamiltonella defendens TaxID=138072 RepID=UPI001582EFD8|nr:hypothetical protein [Candidatus Hamiltonella defensa]
MFGQKGVSVEHFASPKELLSHLHFNAKKLKNYLLNQKLEEHEIEMAITLLKEKIKITPSLTTILEGEKEDKKIIIDFII